jgi:hypothetical protein
MRTPFTAFFTKLVTPPLPPPPAELEEMDKLRLEHLRCDRRQTKAEFDQASAERKKYEDEHRILDAISIYKGAAFQRIAAAQEHPEYGRLCAVEQAAQRRWWASCKQVADFEFAIGVKK